MNSLIKTPIEKRTLSTLQNVRMALFSAFLAPLYFLAAWFKSGIGLMIHLKCMAIGFKLVLKKPTKNHARWIYYPLESTRYFELDFVIRNAGAFKRWLDVSSPHQVSALLLSRNRGSEIDLINPDSSDIEETKEMCKLMGFNCQTSCCTINHFTSSKKYDLITCVSVLEHIPNDVDAFQRMWNHLEIGGRLILTIPAAADGGVQLIDKDPYGLNLLVEGGYFFQRFYSNKDLQNLYAIAGRPKTSAVWGKKEKGWLQRNFERKRNDPENPVWREPYDMAVHWQQYDDVDVLPGEGVFCAVFVK